MKSYNAKDYDVIASMYTEDCKILPHAADICSGKDGRLPFVRYFNFMIV